MKMFRSIIGGALASAAVSLMVMAALPASAQTIVHAGATGNPYFDVTYGNPYSPVIIANFGATVVGGNKAFDYIYEFTVPQNGLGSGSISTSYSAVMNALTLSSVTINGTSYPLITQTGGQSLAVNNIPIARGAQNTVEVKGVTDPLALAGSFTGTATFAAVTAAPEPGAWSLMIAGIGLIGGVLRRRKAAGALALS